MAESVALPNSLTEVVGFGQATAEPGGSAMRRLATNDKLVFEYPSPAEAQQAHDRMVWLADYLPTPAITALQGSWLVTERPAGASAAQPDQHPQPGRLASDVAAAIKRLHTIDSERCPYARSWEDYATEVDAAVQSGRLDAADLPDPYCRYSIDELRQIFIDGRPPTQDLVVAHGTPLVGDFYFEGDDLSGVIVGNTLGVGERNADLAWLQRSVRDTLGDEAVFAFYDAYGPGESLIAVDNFYLASFLLA